MTHEKRDIITLQDLDFERQARALRKVDEVFEGARSARLFR